MQVAIRLIRDTELKDLVHIYNQAVGAGLTADKAPIEVHEKQDWFEAHNPEQYPIFVAEKEEAIVAWSSLSLYRGGRSGVKRTAEISYFVDFAHHRKGIGRRLVRHTITEARKRSVQHLIAILLESNFSSIYMLESEGFKRWGLMPEIVELETARTGHLYYGMHL